MRIAPATSRSDRTGAGVDRGVASVQMTRAAASTATPVNTTSGPVAVAIPPRTGPSTRPETAAAIAAPISSPRRSLGAAPISQARPAVQANAPPIPCATRARSRTRIVSPNANARLETPSSARPINIVCRTPIRAATQPEGSEASRVPAG